MKRIFLTLMVVFLALGLIGFTGCAKKTDKSAAEEEMTAPKGLGPMVVMGTPVVKMSKKSSAVIMGTGFKPKQEVRVLFTTQDGLPSNEIYELLLDGDYLWIGSDRGLTRFLWNDPDRID